MSKILSSDLAFEIHPEMVSDAVAVAELTQTVFGPGMKARAAYALREGVAHEPDLSFVAKNGTEIIGSVRLTKIAVGDDVALMLGPLGVLPAYKNRGVGKALMQKAVASSKKLAEKKDVCSLILVGDHGYYQPFGFCRIPHGNVTMPRPVDPSRVLVCDLNGSNKELKGSARSLAGA